MPTGCKTGWTPARPSGGSAHPRRFEVLNFAVAAYSPLQRLETLRRKVLAFQSRPGDLLGHHARCPPDGDPPLRHAPQAGRPAIRLPQAVVAEAAGHGRGPAGRRRGAS